MGKHQLSAEQWRVISYLYHPDQLAKRLSPTLAVVLDKQGVDRDAVIEVAERGLVQARVGGEECTRGPLKTLPAKAIRLRLTRAGIYLAGNDPQHAVMLALRQPHRFTLWDLMYRLHVRQVPTPAPGTVPPRITFAELSDMADRWLFETFLIEEDIPVKRLSDVQSIPGLAYARQTKTGASYVAYL
ncbi:hypothetical protein AB0C29_15295 [Actinoplanes sp. NPDC048791]|uniref:hypothetical protein n=1 Tax=Actinoplanes sp. NPDC048791 TaxID=3154623 RepID=UPI0033DFAB23